MIFFAVLSCVLLTAITWFDFKDRFIPLFLLLGEVVVGAFYFHRLHLPNYWLYVGLNGLLAVIQIGMVATWLKIRRKGISFFKDAFGWGDVLMILIATLFFSPLHFVWFLLVAAFVSLIYGAVMRMVQKEKEVLIPLAGVMAGLLVMVHVLEWLGVWFW